MSASAAGAFSACCSVWRVSRRWLDWTSLEATSEPWARLAWWRSGYAIGPMIVARRLAGVPALGVVAASLLVTAVVYAPFGLVQMPSAIPSTRVLVAVGILALVCTAVAFLLFFALIGEVGPVRATVITYFNPAVALLLGIVILNEPFTLGAGAGFVLILLGSFLATRRGPRARVPDVALRDAAAAG
ncbi:MAG: DMT family transporter [Chloroflexi bacterium]|nr:MAG: DMT family transporter [Chloroflexota bacterium]